MSSDPIKDSAESPLSHKKIKKYQAKGICVVLEDDFKKSDLENLITAIKQFKGVLDVSFIDFDGFEDHSNRVRIKTELIKQIKDILE